MQTRKAKFQGKKTKWEIKRDKRPAKRAKEGKKPLVEPLEIVSTVERNAAATAGKMIFKDGNTNFLLPDPYPLQINSSVTAFTVTLLIKMNFSSLIGALNFRVRYRLKLIIVPQQKIIFKSRHWVQ